MNSESNSPIEPEVEETIVEVNEPPAKKRRSRYLFIIGALIIVISLGTLFYQEVLSPRVRYQLYILYWANYFNGVKTAHLNDTYGGKTPDETLSLFIEALEKDDLELASKYFALDKGERDPEWLKGLQRIKEEGQMPMIISELKSAQVIDKSERSNYWYYAIYGSDSEIRKTFDIQKDSFSGLWKIGGM